MTTPSDPKGDAELVKRVRSNLRMRPGEQWGPVQMVNAYKFILETSGQVSIGGEIPGQLHDLCAAVSRLTAELSESQRANDVLTTQLNCAHIDKERWLALLAESRAENAKLREAADVVLFWWREWRKGDVVMGRVPTRFLTQGDDVTGRLDAALRPASPPVEPDAQGGTRCPSCGTDDVARDGLGGLRCEQCHFSWKGER